MFSHKQQLNKMGFPLVLSSPLSGQRGRVVMMLGRVSARPTIHSLLKQSHRWERNTSPLFKSIPLFSPHAFCMFPFFSLEPWIINSPHHVPHLDSAFTVWLTLWAIVSPGKCQLLCLLHTQSTISILLICVYQFTICICNLVVVSTAEVPGAALHAGEKIKDLVDHGGDIKCGRDW